MMVEADRAREVWCPFGRVSDQPDGVGGAAAAINRQGKLGTNCLANACMAWRWAGWRIREGEMSPILPNPDVDNRVGARLGYCGLAGKPDGAP